MTVVGTVFGLPQQFFDSAVVRGEVPNAEPAPTEAAKQPPAAARPSPGPTNPAATGTGNPAAWRESGATCLTCGIGVTCPGFATPQEQRAHFKTDWHRYNVKQRLAKRPAVSEEAFEKVLEQGTEVSISGSESETDEEDEEEDEDGLDAGPSGAAGGAAGPEQRKKGKKGAQQQALTIPRETFTAPDGSPFSVWRCLLRQDHVKAVGQPSTQPELLAELRRLRAATGVWVVVLLRGGHFAATVFKARDAKAPSSSKHADPDALEGFDVVAHKTFHRYVVRAKAGGKQSSKDATGKFARSAGSRLRRYNEQALERDVQELLASWAGHIGGADLIFAHAPASNARSLYSEGQATLVQSNPRLRRVPFITHRPTFQETKRVLRLLTTVFRPEAAEELLQQQQSAHLEDEMAAAAEALAATQLDSASSSSAPSTSPPTAPSTTEPDPSTAEPAAPAGAEGPLHRAAKAGDPERVRRLLEGGQDPCALDGKGRPPYALAADKNTRDAFRRFMAQNPDRWDYGASGIPSALTGEMEAAQQAKKAAHKAKLKAKDAERKAKAAEGGGGGGEEQRKAAEAEAAAARRQAVEDEIAQAAAEAAAIAARLNAAAAKAPGRGGGGGGGAGKVGGGGGPSAGGGRAGGGRGGAAGRAGAGGRGGGGRGAAAAVAAAAPPTPEEMARRREMMAAAAEARVRALSQASQQQKLW